MTDARFPERWLNDRRVMRLSPEAFRAFVCALAWAAANRTEGHVTSDDLQMIPHATAELMDDLIHAGLVETNDRSWYLREFELTQTTAAELARNDQKRLKDRARKARQRAHAAGDHSLCRPGDPCDAGGLSHGTSHGTTQDRPGQDRPGQDRRMERPREYAVDGATSPATRTPVTDDNGEPEVSA